MAKALADSEAKIVEELNAVQDMPVEIGGYYQAGRAKVDALMRPSECFNGVLEAGV